MYLFTRIFFVIHSSVYFFDWNSIVNWRVTVFAIAFYYNFSSQFCKNVQLCKDNNLNTPILLWRVPILFWDQPIRNTAVLRPFFRLQPWGAWQVKSDRSQALVDIPIRMQARASRTSAARQIEQEVIKKTWALWRRPKCCSSDRRRKQTYKWSSRCSWRLDIPARHGVSGTNRSRWKADRCRLCILLFASSRRSRTLPSTETKCRGGLLARSNRTVGKWRLIQIGINLTDALYYYWAVGFAIVRTLALGNGILL